jgi:hypothetical protein
MPEDINEGLDFCEITFAVPAQQFGITCSLSTEEALPVVTEFALRVIHVCETMTPKQLEEYFGFGQPEIAAIVHTLLSERLVMWVEDSLELTPYARARFIDSPDGIPRFFTIKDFSADLVFDLMSFVPSQGNKDRVNRVGTLMGLTPRDLQKESRTKVEAERSFQEHFHRVYSGSRAEIYKISDVEAGERFYIALSCRFSIDVKDGIEVRRVLSDPSFDNRLEISSAISKVLSSVDPSENPDLAEFEKYFSGTSISQYLAGSSFDLTGYLRDVHLKPQTRHIGDTIPIVGGLHLESNRTLFLSKLKDHDDSVAGFAYWLAPQNRYWSRSRFVNGFVRSITGYLKKASTASEGASDLVNKSLMRVLLQNPQMEDRELANIYENAFPSLFITRASIMSGRVELLLYPGRVMCALYHYRIENSPMAIPIGILSTDPGQLLRASELLTRACGEQDIYRLDHKGQRSMAVHKDFEFIPQVQADENA